MNPNDPRSIKEQVLAKITSKQVLMRPKIYFTLQLIALALVALLVLATSILLWNYILFSLRASEIELMLTFGWRGVERFFLLFPWGLLGIDVLLVLMLEWLLRKFRFGYRSPVLYLLIVLLALTGAVGLALDRATPLNDTLLSEAREHNLPFPLGEIYEHAHRTPPPGNGVCRCTIAEVGDSALIGLDIDYGTTTHRYTILLPAGTASSSFAVGQVVYVVGDAEGNTIRAFGIEPVPANDPDFPR